MTQGKLDLTFLRSAWFAFVRGKCLGIFVRIRLSWAEDVLGGTVKTTLRTTIGIATTWSLFVLLSACGLTGPADGAIQSSFDPNALAIAADGSSGDVSVTFTVRAGTMGGYLEGYAIRYLDAAGNPLLPGASTLDVDGVGLRLPRGSSCTGFEGCSATDLSDQVSEAHPLPPVPTEISDAFIRGDNVTGRAEITWRAINDRGTAFQWTSFLSIVSAQ